MKKKSNASIIIAACVLAVVCIPIAFILINRAVTNKQQQRIAQEESLRAASEKAEADAAVTKTNAQAKADAKVIEAQAEADANKAISDSIDENVLRNKYYERWDGKLPTTIVGNDAMTSILISPDSQSPSSGSKGKADTTPAPTPTPTPTPAPDGNT